jgi:hypothetical protein
VFEMGVMVLLLLPMRLRLEIAGSAFCRWIDGRVLLAARTCPVEASGRRTSFVKRPVLQVMRSRYI